MKQLRLSYGVADGGLGAATHVFFPHLPVANSGVTHLSNDEQSSWVDNIIRPALRDTCGHHVRQHWPRSFADANHKARVKEEQSINGAGHPIDINYPLPASLLEQYWDCVLRKSNEYPEFAGPVLIVMAHNLKGPTQRNSPALMKHDFLELMESCYDIHSEGYLSRGDAWLDIGVEDVPVTDGVTLLRKTCCLEQWAQGFCDPRQAARHLTALRHPFMLTRDAGSISVELGPSNLLRSEGNLAHNKAYNSNKDLFATPFKPYSAFGNDDFEGLGFSQTHIDRCFEVNRHGRTAVGTRESHVKRPDIVKGYEKSKQRVAVALEDSTKAKSSFGIRSECRAGRLFFVHCELSVDGHSITIAQAAAPPSSSQGLSSPMLSIDNIGSHPPADNQARVSIAEGPHRSYWVLPTEEVNKFTSAYPYLNRWTVCVEASATRARPGPNNRPIASETQQRLHGITISACRRILALAIGGVAPSRRPELMLEKMESREHRQERLRRQAFHDDSRV
ncbi:hypothetical protein HO173_003285 [Letharia columbiana]|uniref:Uncharacterized protein n=1 Tax=Letharia columbiana TaxID=112416 RepID=A0A8H6G1F2_9LECA|nr:uncharacterized protein HO173_003285 [Letharia columbiana]KAF6238778.1 hypothetical protein HO173_003285 [Letharia columbiana]